MSYSSDKVLEVIKETFRDYYKELLVNPKITEKFGEDIIHLRQGIKDGMFTNRISKRRGNPCVYNRYNVIGNTLIFKHFLEGFLDGHSTEQFYDYLIRVNYEMILYRGVTDNRDVGYFPSKFREGRKEQIKIPFSTSTSLDFVKKWIDDEPCCLYIIHVPFNRFRKFYMSGKLQYIPLMYLDEDQKEITLGPGKLKLIRKEVDTNGITHHHLEYEPTKIDEDWDSSMYSEC